MPRLNQIEERIQAAFIEWNYVNWKRWPWASIEVPRRIRVGRGTIEIRTKTLAFFHPPNGGNRSPITGAKMHAIGTRRGILDLWLPVPVVPFCGLVLELKAPKKYLAKEQKNWKAFLEQVGWHVEVCRSLAECVAVTTTYLNLR